MQILCDAKDLRATIYALVASDDVERVRYVGRTIYPDSRFHQHLHDGSTRVARWLAEVRWGHRGARVLMVEIERCGRRPAWHRELHWIKHYRALGMADLNVNDVPRARK